MVPLFLLLSFLFLSAPSNAAYTVYQEVFDPVVPYNPDYNGPLIFPEGITPLHIAAARNNINYLIALLDQGVPIDILDTNEWTPLHYAAFFGSVECAEILCYRGAQVNAQTLGLNTPGHLAILNNHIHTLACLKFYGALPSVYNSSGQTIEQLCNAIGRPFNNLPSHHFARTSRN